jgi:hypothetical protein
MGKLLIAAIVGGILELTWGFVGHVLIGLEERDFQALPSEAKWLEASKATNPPPGMYWYPYADLNHADEAAKKAWLDHAQQTGSAMVVVMPKEKLSVTPAPSQLLIEFATNVLGALILASLAAGVACCHGVVRTAGIGAALGFFAWVSQDASQWNWYHFSTNFTLDSLFDAVVGWTITGIGVGLVLRKKASAAAA